MSLRVTSRCHWTRIEASIGKRAQGAMRDNWNQRQELAKGGECTQATANGSSRFPASQPPFAALATTCGRAVSFRKSLPLIVLCRGWTSVCADGRIGVSRLSPREGPFRGPQAVRTIQIAEGVISKVYNLPATSAINRFSNDLLLCARSPPPSLRPRSFAVR